MTVSTTQRWSSTQGAWLALAVLAHALLLLLPLSPFEFSAITTPPLQIRFTPFVRVAEKAPTEDPLLTANTPDSEATHRVGEDTAVAADPAAAETPVAAETAAERAPGHITLARLIDSLQHTTLDDPSVPMPLELGAGPARGFPSYWRAGPAGLLPAENLFNSTANPAQPEIVDRWLAADGSHNVVVNLPNGDTLCGRALAWDPMRPLVENIMTFRSCAGGGKRSFNMSTRETPEFRYTN
jgi:hypothetical protein